MLTFHWIKCLNDRGLPLVLDSISLISGRIVKWQMESLAYLLAYSNEVPIPSDDWRVHFASEQITNEPFIVASEMEEKEPDDSKENVLSTSKASNRKESAVIKTVTINEPEKSNDQAEQVKSPEKQDEKEENPPKDEEKEEKKEDPDQTETNFYEESTFKIESHAVSAMSRLSEHVICEHNV